MNNLTDSTYRASRVTNANAVLRDTYRLLSATLLWSALAAYLGTLMPVGPIGSLLVFVLAIGALFATSAYRNSGAGVALVFLFTGLMGFGLGPTLNHYLSLRGGPEIVGLSLLSTGAAFLGLSAYVNVTKRDFSFLGGVLLTGLIGLLVVGLVSLFFPIPGLSLVLAYFSTLLFSGYILYDTSAIVSGRQSNYVMATVDLYLNILNLFSSLLRIVSSVFD